jgi:RNA polymerase sigma factor (sigma-70 family)
MTVPALWTRHRRIAAQVASDFRIPGFDTDDVRQEALIALWEAARSYDPQRGPFPPWARRVITARLTDLLRVHTKRGQAPRHVELHDIFEAPDGSAGVDAVRRVVATLPSLTDLEREALACVLNGDAYTGDKRIDNAAQRARRKLRGAA